MAAITESGTVRHGIDRMVRNVETGRFERSLSALTAAGALVTAAEIFFEHDSASFGNKLMWLPVALGPVGAAAGVAGVSASGWPRPRCRWRPRPSSPTGCRAPTCTRAGSPRSPAAGATPATTWRWGRRCWRRCWSRMVGGMGLLAAILRRER